MKQKTTNFHNIRINIIWVDAKRPEKGLWILSNSFDGKIVMAFSPDRRLWDNFDASTENVRNEALEKCYTLLVNSYERRNKKRI